MNAPNKLECLFLPGLSSLKFMAKAGACPSDERFRSTTLG